METRFTDKNLLLNGREEPMASFPVPFSGYNKPRNLKNTPCSLHYNCLKMLQTPSFDTEFCRATSCDSKKCILTPVN